MVRKELNVVYGQSQRRNQPLLINAAAETDRY